MLDPDEDLQLVNSRGHIFNHNQQERTKALVGNHKVKDWLLTSGSRFLVVDGKSSDDRVSPMSFACSMVLTSLAPFQSAMPVSFFCGLHTSIKGPQSGPRIMLRSIITQFLENNQEFDLQFWNNISPAEKNKLRAGDMETLCKLFTKLIKLLPANLVVFCIIVGISYYEGGAQRPELNQFVKTLVNITSDDTIEASFKILLTSPASSRFVRPRFTNREQYLSLPEIIEHMHQGFDSREWQLRSKGTCKY